MRPEDRSEVVEVNDGDDDNNDDTDAEGTALASPSFLRNKSKTNRRSIIAQLIRRHNSKVLNLILALKTGRFSQL